MNKMKLAIDAAVEASTLSPSPWTKVGCVITDQFLTILGAGHNRPNFPAPAFWWNPDKRNELRDFITHAEINAIIKVLKTGANVHTAVLTLMPCVDCIKTLAEAHIREVYYLDELERDAKVHQVAKQLGLRMMKVSRDGNEFTTV
jgi:dCMP deaminase